MSGVIDHPRPWNVRPSGRTVWRLLVFVGAVAVVAAIVLAVSGRAAGANNEADQFATVQLVALDEVPWESGRSVAAEVTVETERAVSGTLTVVSTGEGQAPTTYEFDIDVGGDTTVTVPVDLYTGWNGILSTATLTSNGQVIAGDELRAFGQGNGNAERVATLGIDAAPQRLPLIGGDEQVRTFALDGRLNGLERASSLVATPAAIGGLGADSDEALRVEAWIRGGGQLVVDGPAESLDGRFHRYPTANENRFLLGAGSIVYLETWEDGLPIGGYLGTAGLRELVDSQDLGSGAAGELAILAGISLPSASVIALILLVYSVLAGPIVYGLLRSRGLQNRMWIILPSLSAVFVVGILGFGFVSRTGRSDTHITIVEVNERASRATSNLLLTSSVGGGRGFETPPGWVYLGQGQTESRRPVLLRPGGSGLEVSIETPPGSSSVARVSGVATEYDGMLRIDNISYRDGMVTADVTNASSADLTDVVAFLGNARSEVADLDAGQTIAIEVVAGDSAGRSMRELLIWPRVRRDWNNNGQIAVPTDREAPTAAGAWTEWRTAQGSAAMPETTLGVAGWTDDLDGPVAGVGTGRTALFVRENLPAQVSEDIGFTSVARMVSRNGEPDFNGNFQGYPEDYRVTLSEGSSAEELAVTADRNSAGLGFHTADGWRYVSLVGNGEVTVGVPADAVVDGEVTVRSFTPPWSWGAGLTLQFGRDAEAETPPLVSEPQFRNTDGGDFGPEPGFQDPGLPRPLEEASLTIVEIADEPVVFEGDVLGQSYAAYVVTLEEGGSLTATMSSNSGDSFLEIVDVDGELLASNDDYGRNVDSQIQFTAASAGDYEIRAQALDSGPITYALQIEVDQ